MNADDVVVRVVLTMDISTCSNTYEVIDYAFLITDIQSYMTFVLILSTMRI